MTPPTAGRVRIIGGKWRSRVLRFPANPELRPTSDRIRETLFNWLGFGISGAYCLDLFAGSGALGFEALSRGAAFVAMVEQSPPAVAGLRENAQLLDAGDQVAIYTAAIPQWQLPTMPRKFDLVFLDPPFHHNWLPICWQWLEQQQCLAADALVYLEAESELSTPPIPAHWHLVKSKTAGQVGYHLASNGVQA